MHSFRPGVDKDNSARLKAGAAALKGLRTSLINDVSISNHDHSRNGEDEGTWNSFRSRQVTSSVLQGRLEEMLVLEILKDGGRNYLNLSVRSLYQHVLAAITNPPTLPPVLEEDETHNLHHQEKRTGSSEGMMLSPSASREGSTLETLPIIKENEGTATTTTTTSNLPSDETSGQTQNSQPPQKPWLPPADLNQADAEKTSGVGVTSSSTAPRQPHQQEVLDSWQQKPVSATTASSRLRHSPPQGTSSGQQQTQRPASSTSAQKQAEMDSPFRRGSDTKKYQLPSMSRIQQPSLTQISGDKSHGGFSVGGEGGGDTTTSTQNVTYRERLGAYLHPRDMRKLVMQFSSTNEPEVIVRRHAIILNFDPLRAIILRDRLLVLVPDGADSLLVKLEDRVRGGNKDLEQIMFGSSSELEGDETSSHNSQSTSLRTNLGKISPSPTAGKSGTIIDLVKKTAHRFSDGIMSTKFPSFSSNDDEDRRSDHSSSSQPSVPSNTNGKTKRSKSKERKKKKIRNLSEETIASGLIFGQNSDDEDIGGGIDSHIISLHAQEEWADMKCRDWIQLPFELQCTDAILQTVIELLSSDTFELEQATSAYINEIVHRKGLYDKEDPLTVIRSIKDSVREMTTRTKNFVQSMNKILDDYESMALMNLTRLMTNPEVFIKPVTAETLEEESDEPELILESFLQQALSLTNAVDLIDGQISTAAELVDQKLDAARNKILLANTVITAVALCVDCAMVVSSLFGMNLTNHLEDSDSAFIKVTFWTVGGAFIMFITTLSLMSKIGALPNWRNVSGGGF